MRVRQFTLQKEPLCLLTVVSSRNEGKSKHHSALAHEPFITSVFIRFLPNMSVLFPNRRDSSFGRSIA